MASPAGFEPTASGLGILLKLLSQSHLQRICHRFATRILRQGSYEVGSLLLLPLDPLDNVAIDIQCHLNVGVSH